MYSVVIPSRNLNNLRHCVHAIRINERDLNPRDIIIVDDSDGREILEYARQLGTCWIRAPKPFIFARNINIGLDETFLPELEPDHKNPYEGVVLLNDDAMLETPNGFTMLRNICRDDKTVGLVSPSCNHVGNKNQEHQGSHKLRYEARMLCFICVYLPKHVWDRCGGLDERFVGYGFEDDAYCQVVREAGLKLAIWDSVFVNHAQLKSTFRGDDYPVEGFRTNQRIFEQYYGPNSRSRALAV